MNQSSPYYARPQKDWKSITENLLANYPLSKDEMIKITLESWKGIFDTGIGKEGVKIGKDILPSPQIMGFFLHELIPLNLHSKYPKLWKKDKEVSEKDLIYIPDIKYSMEIKTSSHPNKIFGNRSYAQPASNPKKDKSGYYLAINFEKFSENPNPRIRLIRFGWLDYTDWIGQKAPTGQQAHLKPESENSKLVELFSL
jgi:hypothetical protein